MNGITGMIFKIIAGVVVWWYSGQYASEDVVYSIMMKPLFFIVLVMFAINTFGKEFTFFKRG